MLEVSKPDQAGEKDQGGNRAALSSKFGLSPTDFVGHQAEQHGKHQPEKQKGQDDRVDDEHYIPGKPSRVKGRKRPDTVVVPEIHQDMHQTSQEGIQIEQLPSRGLPDLPLPGHHDSVNKVHDADGQRRHERSPQQRVRKAAMVFKVRDRSAEDAQKIDIRRFGSQRQGESGQSGFAIESGAAQTGSGKKMGYRFQGLVLSRENYCNGSRFTKRSLLSFRSAKPSSFLKPRPIGDEYPIFANDQGGNPMVGGIGNSGNVAELMGMMVQSQAQDPVASAASMDALKKAPDSSASEAGARVR